MSVPILARGAQGTLEYGAWFGDQVLSVFAYLWPGTLVLVLVAAIAWVVALASEPRPPRSSLLLTLATWVVPPFLFVWSVLWRNRTEDIEQAADWAVWVLWGLILLQLGWIVLLVQLREDVRWLATANGAFALWASFCVALVGGMSITGDWM